MTFLDDIDLEALSLSYKEPQNEGGHGTATAAIDKILSAEDEDTTPTSPRLTTPLQFPECRIPPRIHRVAQELQTLPTELIEPIISTLQTSNLIELAIVGDANLRAIISASPSWRPLFDISRGGLDIQRLMRMYCAWAGLIDLSDQKYLCWYYLNGAYDYRWDTNRPLHQVRDGYARLERDSPYLFYRSDIQKFCQVNNLSRMLNRELEFLYNKLLDYTDEIQQMNWHKGRYSHRRSRKIPTFVSLKRLIDKQEYVDAAGIPDSLLPLSANQQAVDDGDADELALRASALSRIELTINNLKSKQLLKLANLVERHPTRLKINLDPREGPETSAGADRLVKTLRTASRLVKTAKLFSHNKQVAQSWFTSWRVKIIPRDCFLHLFLLVYKHHPPGSYPYPEDIASDIDTVIDGLQTVYTSGMMPIDDSTEKERERPIIRRICIRAKNSPPAFSTAEDRPLESTLVNESIEESEMIEKQDLSIDISTIPISAIPPERASFTIPTSYDHRRCCPTEPHDPRELEWLSAFLSCVEYFETNFPELQQQVEAAGPVPCKVSLLMNFGRGSRRHQARRWEMLFSQHRYQRGMVSDEVIEVMHQVRELRAAIKAKEDEEFWEECRQREAEKVRQAEELRLKQQMERQRQQEGYRLNQQRQREREWEARLARLRESDAAGESSSSGGGG